MRFDSTSGHLKGEVEENLEVDVLDSQRPTTTKARGKKEKPCAKLPNKKDYYHNKVRNSGHQIYIGKIGSRVRQSRTESSSHRLWPPNAE